MIQDLKNRAKNAENEINTLFELQDSIGVEIEMVNKNIHTIEEQNIAFMTQKKHLQKVREQKIPDPTIIVNQIIVQGTKIKAPNSSLLLIKDQARCTIQEQKKEDGTMVFFEMDISNF